MPYVLDAHFFVLFFLFSVMTFLLLFIVITMLVPSLVAETVYADTKYGFDKSDSTAIIKAAIRGEEGKGNTLIFRKMSGPWYVTSMMKIFRITKLKIIFEPGFVMEAKRGVFPTRNKAEKLLWLATTSDVTIIGYGATFRMSRADFVAAKATEFNMNFQATSATRLQLFGLRLEGSGGDGIYVDKWTDCLVQDVTIVQHYRQAVSVIDATNVVFRHCFLGQTSGAAPQDGVDFEPNHSYQALSNVVFEDCSIVDNDSNGLHMAVRHLDKTSPRIDISFTRCYFSGNSGSASYSSGEFSLGGSGYIGNRYDQPAQGVVRVSDSVIDGSPYQLLKSRKQGIGYTMEIDQLAAINLNEKGSSPLIYLEVPSYSVNSDVGGITLKNVLMHTKAEAPWMRIQGSKSLTSLRDLHGSVTVVEPKPTEVLYKSYSTTKNIAVTLRNSNQASLPATRVSISTLSNEAVKGSTKGASIVFTRSSSRLDYPLFVKYAVSGVQLGDGIPLLTKAVLIRAGETSVTLNIPARANGLKESRRVVTLKLESRELYSISGTGEAQFSIVDTASPATITTVKPTIQATVPATTAKPTLPTSPSPPQSLLSILQSAPSRQNPVMLANSIVKGSVAIFVGPEADIASVEFFLDGLQVQKEFVAPFDLNGSSEYDSTTLADGTHTLVAKVKRSNGQQDTELSATFQVRNKAPVSLGPQILASSVISRLENSFRVEFSLDKGSQGCIEYGLSSAYGQVTNAELTFQYLTHRQTVKDLTAGTEYHWRVACLKDAQGIISPPGPDNVVLTTGGTTLVATTPVATTLPAAPTTPPTCQDLLSQCQARNSASVQIQGRSVTSEEGQVPLGAIIGGAIGGVVFASCIAVIVAVVIVRKNSQSSYHLLE